MKFNPKRRILTLLITMSLLFAIITFLPSVGASGNANCTDISNDYINESSDRTEIINLTCWTDWTGVAVYLEMVYINFSGSGWSTSDLVPLADSDNSGISLWKDSNSNGVFDGPGTDARLTGPPVWSGNQCQVTPNNNANSRLYTANTNYTWFVVIKTNSTITDDDHINAEIVKVQINASVATIGGTSNVSLIADTLDPSVANNTITSPNGGENWSGTQTITWDTSKISDSHLSNTPITLYYSDDNGSTWTQLATNQNNNGSFGWDTSSVSDGTEYKINITATDNASNTAYDVSNSSFTIDNTAPTCSITYNRSATYFAAGTGLKIHANFTEALTGINESSVKIQIDTAGDGGVGQTAMNKTNNTLYSFNWTIPTGTDDDGNFTVRIYAKDNTSNNLNPYPTNDTTKKIDNTGASATIGIPVHSDYYKAMDTINGSCSDGGSGVSAVNITIFNISGGTYWNGTAWQEGVNWSTTTLGASYDTWSNDSSGVSWFNGSDYQINATAIDNVSNAGSADTNNFTFDDNGLTSNVTPITSYWQTTGSLDINFTATDFGSGLNNVTLYYRYSDDNSTWGSNFTFGTPDESPWLPTAWNFDFSNGSGYYKFHTIATDNASNTESAPAENDTNCAYDPNPPTGIISLPTDGGYYKTGDTIETNITGNATDVRTVTVVTVQIYNSTNNTYFNGSGWQATMINLTANLSGGTPTTNWWYENGSAFPTWLNNKTYNISIQAKDTAGNWNNSTASASFTFDTTSPTTNITQPTNDTWYASLTNITGTASDNGGSKVETVNITIWNQTGNKYWDGSAWGDTSTNLTANLSGTGWTKDWYYSNPSVFPSSWTNGSTYVVNASSTDNSKNAGSWDSNEFYIDIDNVASSVTTISWYWNISGLAIINFTATDTDSGLHNVTLYYRYSDDNSTWGSNCSYGTDTTPWYPTAWNFDFPNSSGYYQFYTLAIDNVSNQEDQPGSPDEVCAYDATGPTVTIFNPLDATYNDSMDTINGTCSDTGYSGLKEVNITIYNMTSSTYWNGTTWQSGKNWSSTVLGTGDTTWSYDASSVSWYNNIQYQINATATDNASNTSIQDSNKFTYDSEAPTVNIGFNNAANYYKNGDVVRIHANFTEDESGIDESSVKITIKNVSSGTNLNTSESMIMNDNTHWYFDWYVQSGENCQVNLSIEALDNVSHSISGVNYSTSKYIDNTNPTVNIEFNDTSNYYRGGDVVKIYANFTEDGSGINESQVKITIANISGGTNLNTSETMTMTDNTHWTFNWFVQNDENCNVNISIYAIDNVSLPLTGVNYSTTKYVDNIDPTGNISTPANDSYHDESLTNISGTATDALTRVATVTITIYNKTGGSYWNGSAWNTTVVTNLTANTSGSGTTINWWYEDGSAFPTWYDGVNYTINLTATDNSGNSNTSCDRNTFHYDTGGPTIGTVTITDVTISSTSYCKDGDTINVTAAVSDSNLASGDTSYIKANLSGFGAGTSVNATGFNGTGAWWNISSVTCTPGNDTITVTINASDKAGNYGTEQTGTITSDNTPPTLNYAIMDADNDGTNYTYVDLYFNEIHMDTSTIAYTDFNISISGVSASAIQSTSGNRTTIKFDTTFQTGDSPTVGIAGSVADLAGNTITSGTVTINTYRIDIPSGYSIISIPANVSTSTIATVTAGLTATVNIWTYDTASGWDNWASGDGDSFRLYPGKGYWINADTADTLIGNYDLWPNPGYSPPSVELTAQSWNLVGHWQTYNQSAVTTYGGGLASLSDSDIGSLWRYNPTGGGYTNILIGSQNMTPGDGYWMYVESSSDKFYSPS